MARVFAYIGIVLLWAVALVVAAAMGHIVGDYATAYFREKLGPSLPDIRVQEVA